ncbi:MAG: TraB/GumN family protein [Burkholderiales bacterium]|nr:TraB/GumN family protein [Burkholderiales bacterium]
MKTRLASLLAAATVLAATAALPVHAQLAKPFLWELTKDGKTVTLFGSLHVGKNDFFPLPEAVLKRFDEAKVLAVEADITMPETQQACIKLGATTDKLESVLPAEDYAALMNYAKASGLPDNAFQNRKLWLLNLVVVGVELGQLGVDFSRGLDVVFLRDAKKEKKRIAEVEGGMRQCSALAAATNAESAASMARFLATVRENKMEKRLDEMVNAYRAGDAVTMARVINEEFGTSPEGLSARKRVFDNRHPAMADMIETYFKQTDKHFVVIGVGHMVGENNLLESLAKKGVSIKRVE